MSQLPETNQPFILNPASAPITSKSKLQTFLTYLAFEGHGVRIGLELTLCMLIYSLLDTFIPWSFIGVDANWQSVFAWFSGCILVMLFDVFFLCRPVHLYRKCFQLGLSGSYAEAMKQLEQIGPTSRRLIHLPKPIYHLLRAELLTHVEVFKEAKQEIHFAELAGASKEQIYIARCKLLRSEGAFASAHTELNIARQTVGETAIICLEEAFLLLEERKDIWKAKKILKAVCDMPDEIHFSGENTTQLAKAYLEVARLWTGEAEEGLQGLSQVIERMRSKVMYVDPLRPILAYLCLERSFYLATHKEPLAACADAKLGLTLCSYPAFRKRVKEVQEELEWRYRMLLPT